MNTIVLRTIDVTYLSATGFPFRFACTPEEFMTWTRNVQDPMVTFEVCWQFIAWLEHHAPQHLGRISPRMPAGTLLEGLRLIERALRDPSVLELEDRSNRDGKVVVFGSAGLDHEWSKMCRSIEGLRVASLKDAEKLEEEAGMSEMAAEHSARNGNDGDAVVFAEHAIALRADATIRRALAQQCLSDLVANDIPALVARYRAAGSFGNVSEETVAVNVGSLGGAEYNEDGKKVVTEGEEYRVAETLENFETMADNASLRAKVRAVRRRRA